MLNININIIYSKLIIKSYIKGLQICMFFVETFFVHHFLPQDGYNLCLIFFLVLLICRHTHYIVEESHWYRYGRRHSLVWKTTLLSYGCYGRRRRVIVENCLGLVFISYINHNFNHIEFFLTTLIQMTWDISREATRWVVFMSSCWQRSRGRGSALSAALPYLLKKK